jgi:thiol-disulfide isomerase/thioredoxin
MKKKILFSVLAALCHFVRAVGQPQPLKIGDKLPDMLINHVLNHSSNTINTASYRGKLLIIDFWATWCSPCVTMIPKMEALQNTYKGKIQFLPVTLQPAGVVTTFMDKLEKRNSQHYHLPEITGDTVLSKLFPHFSLPHYVWIDQQGIVRAFTEFQDVNAKTIDQFLNHQQPDVKQKLDAPALSYNDSIPLLVNGNGGDGRDLIYHSVMTKYKAGLPLQRLIIPQKDGSLRINCKNLCILQLFATAYLDKCRDYLADIDRVKLNVRDTSKVISHAIGMEYDNWLASGNGFCYEVTVPANMRKQVFSLMREELSRIFPEYVASIMEQQKPCLELKRIGSYDKLISKGGTPKTTTDEFEAGVQNQPIRYWTATVNAHQLSKLPLVNRTNITENVDLKIKSDFQDLEAVNKQLKVYGLKLEPGLQQDNALVISDRNPELPHNPKP